jgi:hypothetical protein
MDRVAPNELWNVFSSGPSNFNVLKAGCWISDGAGFVKTAELGDLEKKLPNRLIQSVKRLHVRCIESTIVRVMIIIILLLRYPSVEILIQIAFIQ